MVRSLSRQQDLTVPIHLIVFHHRAEDAQLLQDGFVDAPSTLTLKFVPLPENRILQRALHFSEAHRMHSLSHTVFFDSDLWFPPSFWSGYAEALSCELPGYWSCPVLELPLSKAELLLEDWNTLTQHRLEGLSTGPRYARHGGKVGTFQCIPRGLVDYPADPRASVAGLDIRFAEVALDHSLDRRDERRIGKIPAYHFDHPHSWEGTGGVQL